MSAPETPGAAEVRARMLKANRLVAVLSQSCLGGDDVWVLVEAAAPILGEVERAAGVRPASPATWETVAVLLDERRRVLSGLTARPSAGYMPDPGDPFSGLG